MTKVETPSKEFRRRARVALEGKWKEGIKAYYLYTAIPVLLPFLTFFIFAKSMLYIETESGAIVATSLAIFLNIVFLVLLFAALILSYGLRFYTRELSLGREVHLKTPLTAFHYVGEVFLLKLLQGVFIYLWSWLFFFPGIIAFYRYRMAPYLLMNNPKKAEIQCIRDSKKFMKGNKWKLFSLDLSFIGWWFLTVIPIYIVFGIVFAITTGFQEDITEGNMFYLVEASVFGAIIFLMLIMIPISALTLYMRAAEAEFAKEAIQEEEDFNDILVKAEAYDKLMEEKLKKEEVKYRSTKTKLMP